MAHKFDPDNRGKLDNKERRKKLPPRQLLENSGLKQGELMVDIGCGIGYFTFPAAKIVGEEGMVYALDTEEVMLKEVEERKSNKGYDNIITVQSGEYGLDLDIKADFILFSNLLHEVEDREKILESYLSLLKKGGRVGIIEWQKKSTEGGPPLKVRISMKKCSTLLKTSGLEIFKKDKINSRQYFILASK